MSDEHETEDAPDEDESEADEYEIELTSTREDAATLLRRTADGVASGTIRVGTGEEARVVSVPDELAVELELEVEDEEYELEIELEWSGQGGGGDDDVRASPDAVETADEPDEGGEEGTETEDGADETEAESGVDETVETDDTGDTAQALDDVEAGTEAIPVGPAERTGAGARFELFEDRVGEWRWRLVHRNGNVIAASGEGYTRKANARKGLESVRTNAPVAEVVEESGT